MRDGKPVFDVSVGRVDAVVVVDAEGRLVVVCWDVWDVV